MAVRKLWRVRCSETMSVQTLNGTWGAPTAHAIGAWFGRVRLRHWAHFLLLPLATFDPRGPHWGASLASVRGIASAFAILAFGYLLNSVADRRMDIDVRKNPFIVPGTGEHRYSLTGLLGISLGLAALSPWPAQLATASSLVFGCIYSMGPRLKSIPVAGSLANIGNFAPLLFVGMRDTALPPHFGYVVAAFSGLLLQNQLIHEAADQVEDRFGGLRTTWLAVGPRWTSLIAGVAGLGATVAAACIAGSMRPTMPIVGAGGVSFVVAFPLLLARRGIEPDRAARLRVTHRWCALMFGAALYAAWQWAV
jgi:4-hydroxybenzoate polyprenyltransferase